MKTWGVRVLLVAWSIAWLGGGAYDGPLPATGSQVVSVDVQNADVSTFTVDGAAVVWIFDP